MRWCALFRNRLRSSTGSMMSLASGFAFGGLLAYGAYRTSADPKDFIFLFGGETNLHKYYIIISPIEGVVEVAID